MGFTNPRRSVNPQSFAFLIVTSLIKQERTLLLSLDALIECSRRHILPVFLHQGLEVFNLQLLALLSSARRFTTFKPVAILLAILDRSFNVSSILHMALPLQPVPRLTVVVIGIPL